MATRGDAYQPERITAQQLCAEHVGRLVRFRTTRDDRETAAIHTGELRQLSIDANHVTLLIGYDDKQEHTLAHGDNVIIRPAEDYTDVASLLTDVASLLGNDPEYVQFGLR